MLLQRLATGATGVKQARYRRGPTRGSEALVRACAVYTQPIVCMEGPWHLLFNVRQRMVYMNSAEGFALLVLYFEMHARVVSGWENVPCLSSGVSLQRGFMYCRLSYNKPVSRPVVLPLLRPAVFQVLNPARLVRWLSW